MNQNIYKVIVFSVLVLLSCNKTKKSEHIPLKANKVHWKNAQDYYIKNMDSVINLLDSLRKQGVKNPKAKQLFFDIRKVFKKAEPYAGVLNPEVTHRANGPALPVYKDDSGRVIEPVGLQKLEETIFDDDTNINLKEFNRDIYFLEGFFKNLKENISKRAVNPKRFFLATHQQLMRIVSLSLAGFDTPVSGHSISEIAISLQSLYEVYNLTIQPIIKEKDLKLDRAFKVNIQKAIHFIDQESNFETFDRFYFIKNHFNLITKNWVEIRQTSDLWDADDTPFPFNFNAPTFFEEDSFNVNFFLDVNDRNPSKEKIMLGKKLFFDESLSQKGNMSCATCHLPEKAYADGLKLSKGNDGSLLQRNTPTLLNSIYQKAFFWDGRANTIENQINSVFNNDKEFNTGVHRFSGNILKDTTYIRLFKEAYGIVPKSNKETVRAISVFVSTLHGLNSKFDRNIRNEEDSFTEQEKRGFNLYMGKALCATCHFIPLTNGTVPPFFSETEKEVIGVPATKENKSIDTDKGFYWVFEEKIHENMFKTPTLRNVEATGPYMHNGVYETLEEVMDFYNKGGGSGLGFDVPHQTLPFDNLNLSEEETQAIIAFMKTLTDSDISETY
ncbi:cytochrome-c peroxidase [Flavivirga algicola]|uniref:Cytochrome-c peroxidase n=1 Tax=Flavivirga algicola TaxID=2729136 RepID=A0ABX1S4D1_9FLAO|nr:cytochrome c peroxidase [Flavivirga algicola]NMH89395.1 cytochrome-c peroxidase [Flavivirga algicola]